METHKFLKSLARVRVRYRWFVALMALIVAIIGFLGWMEFQHICIALALERIFENVVYMSTLD